MVAKLEIRHDGIKAHATVTRGGKACTLDSVIQAAIQPDAELAGDYRSVLAEIAPEVALSIDRVFDGPAHNRVEWLVCTLYPAAGEHRHSRLTDEFRITPRPDRTVSDADEVAVLRRAVEIGLGSAKKNLYAPDRGINAKTVAEVLAAKVG